MSSVPSPALVDLHAPASPEAWVLVLHGGAEHDRRPVTGTNRSFLRGRLLARDVGRRLDDSLGIALLRYGVRGWNVGDGSAPSPVPDARWAIDELVARSDRPVVLLGHSMGGRTAAAVADHPSVRGVVALAPWFPVGEPVDPLREKTLLAAHGSTDRITLATATRQFVARAEAVADASFVDMGPVGHYLLADRARWNDVAADGCHAILGREGS